MDIVIYLVIGFVIVVGLFLILAPKPQPEIQVQIQKVPVKSDNEKIAECEESLLQQEQELVRKRDELTSLRTLIPQYQAMQREIYRIIEKYDLDINPEPDLDPDD